MTNPDIHPKATAQKPQASFVSVVEGGKSFEQSNQSVSFREAVKRGWDWVIFTWQMLRRIGGPIDLLLAFWTLISLLGKRLLVQMGLLRK